MRKVVCDPFFRPFPLPCVVFLRLCAWRLATCSALARNAHMLAGRIYAAVCRVVWCILLGPCAQCTYAGRRASRTRCRIRQGGAPSDRGYPQPDSPCCTTGVYRKLPASLDRVAGHSARRSCHGPILDRFLCSHAPRRERYRPEIQPVRLVGGGHASHSALSAPLALAPLRQADAGVLTKPDRTP